MSPSRINITNQSAAALAKAAPMPHYKGAAPAPPQSAPPESQHRRGRPWRASPMERRRPPRRVRTHGGRRHS